jgi:subtilase family protein
VTSVPAENPVGSQVRGFPAQRARGCRNRGRSAAVSPFNWANKRRPHGRRPCERASASAPANLRTYGLLSQGCGPRYRAQMTGLLHLSRLPPVTRAVRVAVVDSGVHAAHPHVQGISGGVGVDSGGHFYPDFVDRLGHGTAVAAAIREKAPSAELFAIKIFDLKLATTALALISAIDWALRHQTQIITLSLGTTNREHERRLAGAIERATASQVTIVSAAPTADERWLPGALPGVVSVALDWTLPRDVCGVELTEGGEIRMRASGYPRPIPGVDRERNLKGVSFAVANATGLLTRVIAHSDPRTCRNYLSSNLAGLLDAARGTAPSS